MTANNAHATGGNILTPTKNPLHAFNRLPKPVTYTLRTLTTLIGLILLIGAITVGAHIQMGVTAVTTTGVTYHSDNHIPPPFTVILLITAAALGAGIAATGIITTRILANPLIFPLTAAFGVLAILSPQMVTRFTTTSPTGWAAQHGIQNLNLPKAPFTGTTSGIINTTQNGKPVTIKYAVSQNLKDLQIVDH